MPTLHCHQHHHWSRAYPPLHLPCCQSPGDCTCKCNHPTWTKSTWCLQCWNIGIVVVDAGHGKETQATQLCVLPKKKKNKCSIIITCCHNDNNINDNNGNDDSNYGITCRHNNDYDDNGDNDANCGENNDCEGNNNGNGGSLDTHSQWHSTYACSMQQERWLSYDVSNRPLIRSSMPATLNSRQQFSALSPIIQRWPLPVSLPRSTHQRSRPLPNMSVSNWRRCWDVLAARMTMLKQRKRNIMQPRRCLHLQPHHPAGSQLFLANANALVYMESPHQCLIVFTTQW